MTLFSKKQSNIPRRRSESSGEVKQLNTSAIFKRNRTLTGFSPFESPRVHAHHLAIKRRNVFSVLVIIIITAVFLWVIISHFTATVVISTSDTALSKTIEATKYRKAVQDYLDINPLGRFQFLLDQTNLNAYISNKLPEVESIMQEKMVGIGETDFAITMRTPVAGWRINNKQYYVDAKGVPFEQNYFSTPIVQIVDNSGASLQAGEASVSKRFLGFVGLVVALAKSSGYTVTQATLPSDTTRELDVKLKENDLLVKMSIDRPAGEQVEDMSRAVLYFAAHGQAPGYIDVRVSGKAFYK